MKNNIFINRYVMACAISIVAVAADAAIFLYDIMVSVKKINPVLLIIFGEKPEHIAVYVYDLLHGTVFPKIIAIPKLNIGVAVVVVVLQSRKIKVLIF